MTGRINIIERLLDRGVDINGIPDSDAIDFWGIGRLDTALDHAVRYDKKDSVITLLRRGADKSLKDSEGQTALDIAEEKGYQDVIHLL